MNIPKITKLGGLMVLIFVLVINSGCAANTDKTLRVGAEQTDIYLPLLKNKKVGLMVNQTSLVDTIHLLDFLLAKNIKVEKIFAAEHGFRGEAAAGELIKNGVDIKTGVQVISLYGESHKPTPEQLAGVDVVVFDIQDVGCRFYTYISSMHYLMEACAENGVKMLVLDRPNPNGDYVDGPVLDTAFTSFVGMHPIPVVHGCTVGEIAQMINGEGWLKDSVQCELEVVPVANYNHKMKYSLPVKPSPNLPNDLSIRLYPSLCFFEATNVSIGRGTYFPFQVIAYPDPSFGSFEFTPVSIKGMSTNPRHEGVKCYGANLQKMEVVPRFTLSFFMLAFEKVGDAEKFWNSKRWIELLAGNNDFYEQINSGLTDTEIRETWQPKLEAYKKMRKQYLLYPDFEP